LAVLCGVDIVEIDRIKSSIDSLGQSFMNKVFTPGEIDYCESKKSAKYQSYAARFAAKEAVSKAFGTGMGSRVSWRDVEVYNDEFGKPHIALWGKARDLFNELNAVGISLSLSHCKAYAVAYVVIEVR
jgi:holo-[acyl-carrier protein] synthase